MTQSFKPKISGDLTSWSVTVFHILWQRAYVVKPGWREAIKLLMLCFWIDLCRLTGFFKLSFQWIYFLVFFLMILSRFIAIRSRCYWLEYNTIKEMASSLFCICFLLKTNCHIANFAVLNAGFTWNKRPTS